MPTEPGSTRTVPLPVACEEHQVIAPGVIAKPAEPSVSSGLRPILSTRAIVTRVTGTLTIEVTTAVETNRPR
jgi:hypothetical protein